jgi:hypothetical protein
MMRSIARRSSRTRLWFAALYLGLARSFRVWDTFAPPLLCSPFQVAGAKKALLARERLRMAATEQAGGAIIKTTVDHVLMRGLVAA